LSRFTHLAFGSSWRRQALACLLLAAVALGAGAPASLVALGALAVALGTALLRGGKLMRRAIEVSRVRADRRLAGASARRGLALARTHDWLRKTQDALGGFASSSDAGAGAVEAAEASLEMLDGLRDSLDATRASRNQFKGGHIPIMGGNAEAISERLGGTLKPYSWTPGHLLPGRFRGAATQTSMVIDEIRVLHNAEIERSVLLLTLVARAILLLLAPLLGSWTNAATPVSETGAVADAFWLLAAGCSLATMLAGPEVVDLAMSDSEKGFRFRRKLLWIEVPICLGLVLLQPAWTVVVFTTGWTNWWQRQTPELAFDWRKLAIFVAAVIGLQSAGLALQSVAFGPGLVEVVAALAAIAITGGSYGAMLPLTAATAIGVVVGDSTRSIRVARAARLELMTCSRQLAITAATIDAAAPEIPQARNAARLARTGARNLEREADLFGRRGVQARQVLADLFDQAIAQSTLPRPDSSDYAVAAEAAEAAGLPVPPYAIEPILGELALARVRERRHAQALQRFTVTALNEASNHGTEGVRVLAKRRHDRFLVTVGNLPKAKTVGKTSEGRGMLERFASKLPGGRLTEPVGPRPSAAVGLPIEGSWWVVELECDVTILTIPLE
jgi:hypothetical protein